MARQDDHIRHTIRVPRAVYDRIAALPGEGSINAKIVNVLDAAASGKTIRDEFAMAALTGLATHPDLKLSDAAGIAYRAADLMLAERKKGGAS